MTKKLHLHLDEDASQKALFRTLLERGHDVTHTPNEWMPFTATDEEQLLGDTAYDRAIFTYSQLGDLVVHVKKQDLPGTLMLQSRSNS